MTKKEAVKRFKEYVLPHVYCMYGKNDKPALRESFNNFTDSLCKDGYITEKQYNTWSNPF